MFNSIKIIFSIFLISSVFATDANKLIAKTDISGQWFLAYNNANDINQFALKRGYFTIKTKMNDIFSVRYTQDITLDKEGSDAGNVEIRLKYLYLKMELDKIEFLKDSYIEIGLVHRPWIDFEQSVNKYRVQGKMFLERYSIISSADFGIYYTGLLGGKVNDSYLKKVTSKNPGKYGSFALGFHNGGGYHAIEQNNNKTVEGRLTLRPFSEFYPGLELTYAYTYGKANTENNLNDFIMNLLYISSETELGVFTGQYFTGKGDYKGKYVDENDESYSNTGFSLFGELNISNSNFSIFGRFDEFESEFSDKQNTYLGGIAYKFLKNKVLFNVDSQRNGDDTINVYELALEIGF